jgi:hypothetical protein
MDAPLTPPPALDPWRRAHETARALHDALRRLGVAETVLGPLTARQDASGVHRVVLPPLPTEAAELLLRALGPALGPPTPAPLVGRPDALSTSPGRPT